MKERPPLDNTIKKPWVTVKLEKGSSYLCPADDLSIIECEIKTAIECESFDDKWTLTIVFLTDAEVEELGEFEGH